MGQRSSAAPFDLNDARAIAREINSVAAVAPSSSRSVTAVFGNHNWSTLTTGIDDQYFKVVNWTIEAGRHFTESELRAGKAVCILGAAVRNELFGAQNPLGEKIRLGKLSCLVVGLLKAKGQSAMNIGTNQDDVALLPLRTFQRRITGDRDIHLLQVTAEQGASTEKVQQDIEVLLRKRRHISPSENDDFSVMDMKEIADMLTETTQLLTMLLGTVAAISLLVGGIGIMNIMLVSVTERTREIGIRLAIGALEHEVLLQFLVEAVVLSALGGVVGIVLALAGAYLLAGLMRVPFVLNPGVVAMAFLFSAAVGVLFGYFPARKAARLNPIDALRHE